MRAWARWMVVLLLPLAGPACDRVDPELQPDQLLRDSLSLGDEDRVFTVGIHGSGNRETAEPANVELRPGDHVQFVVQDGRPHTVRFLVDSLPQAAADFLRRTAQEGSPPLVETEARFLVTFEGAPEGRYPFLVEGTGAPVRGAVVVVPEGR